MDKNVQTIWRLLQRAELDFVEIGSMEEVLSTKVKSAYEANELWRER